MVKRASFFLLLFFTLVTGVMAQVLRGRVVDAATGEGLPGVHVFYPTDMSSLATTDNKGDFKLPFHQGDLLVSMMGYESRAIRVSKLKRLVIQLKETYSSMDEVEVKAKRQRYERKGNPAVDVMRKVIDAKRASDLHQHDFFSYMKYEKMIFSLNEFTEQVFDDEHFKRMPFLKEHVEVHPVTGKLILPLTIEEKVSQQIYKKETNTEKSIVVGQRNEGINDIINSGEILTTTLADCFNDINIYDDDVRLFQYHFTSPLSSSSALGFYRYYLVDTLMVNHEKCYQIDFTPNNPQDFGFSGSLYVLADSTWRVRRADISVPSQSGVNFVDELDITQEYTTLPSGEQFLSGSNTLVQLSLVSWLQKFQVERTASYSMPDFNNLPERLFRFGGDVKVENSARMRDERFWEDHRPAPLTTCENQVDNFVDRISNIKGFKPVLWVTKAIVENNIETTLDPKKHPNLIDVGPVNSVVGSNFVEGFRIKLGAQTTSFVNPHWFLKGYAKYGFGDQRWKGMAQLTYSFIKKDYNPREYPVRSLTLSYHNDVMSPSDKFLYDDKDNVFLMWKWTKVKHMNYYERFNLLYDWEWESGFRLKAQLRREWNEGAGELFYQPLSMAAVDDASGLPSSLPSRNMGDRLHRITFTEAQLSLQYQPGATFINTKQRRYPTNFDSPILGLSHTTGIKGFLGGQYNYNFTEATLYKRFWLNSWGKIDAMLKGGIQWNRVPYPFLIMPAANTSVILQPNTFCLVGNMEFLNDRYASAMLSWDLNGKLFNRIPLIKRLHWREVFGCNLLWGSLTDKNNPFLTQNQGSEDLFFFPGVYNEDGVFESTSKVMQRNKPYAEVFVGIHNVLKFFQIEYVHRLNYLEGCRHKWGIRATFKASF